MDLEELDRLWERHPAWRVLRAHNAPLILSFLGRRFIDENRGAVPLGELVSALDDELFAIHRSTPERYTQEAAAYVDDWSDPRAGLLRRFYPAGSEEVHVEATPALEKAYRWVESLRARSFVGTESRLQTLVERLRQIVHGSQADPLERIAELNSSTTPTPTASPAGRRRSSPTRSSRHPSRISSSCSGARPRRATSGSS